MNPRKAESLKSLFIMKNTNLYGFIIPILIIVFLLTTNVLAAGYYAQLVADIRSGANGSYPSYPAVFSGKLYFSANGGDGAGIELWAYDGTNTPSRVADINSGSSNSNPSHLAVFNGKLYFRADGGDDKGHELWAYDGSNPPSRIADIYVGPVSSSPAYLTVFNNKLYFSADGDDGAGYELWAYDGTNTPSRVADIYNGVNDSGPAYLTVFNNKLYFSADGDDGKGYELWAYDGTNTPSLVADIYNGADDSNPGYLTVFNNKLHFRANGGNGAGYELWAYDGSNPPSLVADIYNGVNDSGPAYLTVFNNKLYFSAYGDGGAGYELWAYDGTNPPSLVADIFLGPVSSYPDYLATFNGNLYFSADDGYGAGDELRILREDNASPFMTVSNPANGVTIQPTNTLLVTFNEDVKHDGGAAAADFTDNYMLLEANGDGFQTDHCVTPWGDIDLVISIDSAVYSNHGGAGPFEATLVVNGGAPLPNGSYRLIICGSRTIEDLAGNKINGGDDTLIDFTVLKQATAVLPQTGFAPGVITNLPAQNMINAYEDLGTLWIEVPALDIAAPIVGVPVIQNGWNLSWLGDNVGWLHGTAFPTWAGNSALTAHVYDADGQPGLFANLYKLKWGDEVIVHAWGQSYVYEVRNNQQYVKPENINVITHEEYPWLTLITCKEYDAERDEYRWRVVVRAVQVRVE